MVIEAESKQRHQKEGSVLLFGFGLFRVFYKKEDLKVLIYKANMSMPCQ